MAKIDVHLIVEAEGVEEFIKAADNLKQALLEFKKAKVRLNIRTV